MLTGTRAFPGDDMTETLASVVRAEPDWHALPAHTPPKIRTLVFRCLQKDIKKRTRDAGDIVIELDEASAAATMSIAPPARVSRILSRHGLLLGLTAFVLGGLVTGLAVWRLKPEPAGSVNRFTMALPPGQRLAGLNQTAIAFSPDGRRVVYVARAGGPQQLYLREMDSLEGGKPIPGTEGAANPFFSPDGQSVGFFTVDRLKTASLSDGRTKILARVTAFGLGGSWGSDGNIIFASHPQTGLSLVSAEGGPVHTLTKLAQKGKGSHRFPHHLPGGGALLFTVGTGGSWDDARIEVLKLGTGERTLLIEGGSDARYVPTGHVVYRRRGTLLAVRADLDRLQVTGSPVAVVEGLSGCTGNNGCAQATLTEAGSLLYLAGSARSFERTLAWVDRTGAEQSKLPSRAYGYPSLSPDGQRVVLTIDEGNKGDVWVYDLARGNLTKLTSDGLSRFPLWTSDGKKVTFQSTKAESFANLFWKPADDSAAEEQLTTSENPQIPGSWSPDGETLAFTEIDPTTQGNIWTLSLKTRQKAEPFLRTPANEAFPAFSADGRWVAYQSDESDRYEVYVRPFPGSGSKRLVSTDGGTEPVWSRDGRTLFYRNGDQIMAVATMTQPTLSLSKPEVLFERPDVTFSLPRNYDVTSDGSRLLIVKENQEVTAAIQIVVVQNWNEELKQRVPTR
jgi:serine/threonine-protein kinase